MLIIAVIVAVSIRITKAKLDKVVSYTYYSAYSTLSDISRSMYLDIKSNRVDREYLVKHDSSRKLKYVIAYIREDLSDKFAYLAAKFKECVELPAYADFNGVGSLREPWVKEPVYLCKDSEYMLDRELCGDVLPQYHIPDEYIVKFKAGCKSGDTVYDYDGFDEFFRHCALVDNSCERYEGEISFSYCSFQYYGRLNNEEDLNDPSKYSFSCPIPEEMTYYDTYENFFIQNGDGGMRDDLSDAIDGLDEKTYYTIYNYKPGMTIAHLYPGTSREQSQDKDTLFSKLMSDFRNNCSTPYIGSEYYCKSRYGVTWTYSARDQHAVYIHHVKDANYGIRTLYKCTKTGYDVAGHFIDYRNTCVNGEGRIPEALPEQALLTCPGPANYAGLEKFKIGDSDVVYVNLNQYTIGGTCAYAAVKCPEGTFLNFSGASINQVSKSIQRFFQGCLPCEEYNSLPYADKSTSIYNNSCGPNEPEPEPETPDPDSPDSEDSNPDPDTGDEPTPPVCDKNPEEAPCGQELDETTCTYVSKPGFSRDCPDGKIWNDSVCGCVNKIATLPQDSHKFCDLFETYVNIANGTPICSGDSISDSTTDFSDKKPDLTLRNGIKLYNMSSNAPTVINDLKRTEIDESGDLSDASLEILYNQKGYLVYADIDGKNGDSKLWEDVYPFYITLSGKVIPLYDKSHPGVSGGDSKVHLEVSVARRRGGIRGISWIAKSVPFRDAACIAGYISPDTPYCNGIPVSSRCSNDNKYSCSLKVIKPVGFFF